MNLKLLGLSLAWASVLVTNFYITNYSKTYHIKTITSLSQFLSLESGMASLGSSVSEYLMTLQPWLQLFKGLTRAGGFTSKMAHSHGCELKASVSPHVGFSTGLSKDSHNIQLGSPEREEEREREIKVLMSCNIRSDISSSIVYWSHRPNPTQYGRGLTQGHECQKIGIVGGNLHNGRLAICSHVFVVFAKVRYFYNSFS